MSALLADGRASIDQGVSTFLFLGAAILGLVAVQRLRGRSFRGVPRMAAWAAAGLAVTALVLAVVLPPIIRPGASGSRPSSTARLRFLSPVAGETFKGNPAAIPVRLQLMGATIVPFTSNTVRPDQGHIHLLLDGALVFMGQTLTRFLEVEPGRHALTAEFVAADHAPFDPPVRVAAAFRVVGS
jgi:hypothetical protein